MTPEQSSIWVTLASGSAEMALFSTTKTGDRRALDPFQPQNLIRFHLEICRGLVSRIAEQIFKEASQSIGAYQIAGDYLAGFAEIPQHDQPFAASRANESNDMGIDEGNQFHGKPPHGRVFLADGDHPFD